MKILLKNLSILLTTAIIGSATTVGYSSNNISSFNNINNTNGIFNIGNKNTIHLYNNNINIGTNIAYQTFGYQPYVIYSPYCYSQILCTFPIWTYNPMQYFMHPNPNVNNSNTFENVFKQNDNIIEYNNSVNNYNNLISKNRNDNSTYKYNDQQTKNNSLENKSNNSTDIDNNPTQNSNSSNTLSSELSQISNNKITNKQDELYNINVTNENAQSLLDKLYTEICDYNNKINISTKKLIELINESFITKEAFVKYRFYYFISKHIIKYQYNSQNFKSKNFKDIWLKNSFASVDNILKSITKNYFLRGKQFKELNSFIKENRKILQIYAEKWLEQYKQKYYLNLPDIKSYITKINEIKNSIINNISVNLEEYKINNDNIEHILFGSNHVFENVGKFEDKNYTVLNGVENQEKYKLIYEIIKHISNDNQKLGMYNVSGENKNKICEIVKYYLLRPLMHELLDSNTSDLDITSELYDENSIRLVVNDLKENQNNNKIVLSINKNTCNIITFHSLGKNQVQDYKKSAEEARNRVKVDTSIKQ